MKLHKIGCSSAKFTPPPPHNLFNYFNSLGKKFQNKTGFSLTELLVALGISVIVVSTASVSYMKYLRKSKQAALILSAQSFLTGAKACFAVSEDEKAKCDSASELKFSCSNCTFEQHKTANRVSFRMDTDDLKVCAVYRPDCDHMVNGITVNWKTCITKAKVPGYCGNDIYKDYKKPGGDYKECSSTNDCETGQICDFLSSMKGENGPLRGCGLGGTFP